MSNRTAILPHARAVLAILALGALGALGLAAADEATAEFQAKVMPVLNARCAECHGAEKQKAKLNLTTTRTMDQLGRERALWFRVLDRMQAHEMPPADEKQPSDQERQAVAGWITGSYTDALLARQKVEGRSRLRRLNRSEYANTVQDLFGIRPTISLDLPADGRADGYDKVAAALPMSAASAGGYVKLTEEVLHWMLRPLPGAKAAPAPPQAHAAFDPKRTIHAEAMESGQSPGHTLKLPDGTMVSFNSDLTSGRLNYPGAHVPGMHRIRVSLYGYQTDQPMAFGLYAGHTDAYPQLLDLLTVLDAPPGSPQVLETEVYLRTADVNDLVGVADKLRVVPFGIGVQVPKNSQASVCKGPGLAVQWMEVESPELPLPGDRWLTADFPPALDEELRRSPQAALPGKHAAPGALAASTNRDGFLSVMHATFARIGARLFRRDLSNAELERTLTAVAAQIDDGVPLARAFLDQLAELMTTPDFLCVVEAPGLLSDFALASRLSYFLWDSTPDEALLALARRGQLRNPKVLREQTERLLDDPRSARFVDDFLDQWLGLRAINDTSPDSKLYPGYDDYLKLSSLQETRAYFHRMLKEDLPVRMLVSSPWLLVNDTLARHYGLPAVTGYGLRQVPLDEGSPYGGLWTQCAVLKVTANGTATSPVKRGLWVANRLLGIDIPPPPPNVKPVDPDTRGATTLREQLALHRGSGSCAACHAKFDPYGFALESFDVAGSFRTRYREVDNEVAALNPDSRKGRPTWRDGLAVDASGTTPDGIPFSGIAQLRTLLAAHPEALARGVIHHLVTYATGAPAGVLDRQAIEAMVASAAAQGYGMRALVHALVQSALFHWK
jgi:mono/diheme cytochrome c family protein